MALTAQIIVARAEVTAEVDLDEQAPDEILVAAGTDLYVKFPYHYVESSTDKEVYTFELDARLGDGEPLTTSRTWHDRPVLRDEVQGVLQHCFPDLAAGSYDLTFRAAARYSTRPWRGEGEDDETTVGVEGTVRVRVE